MSSFWRSAVALWREVRSALLLLALSVFAAISVFGALRWREVDAENVEIAALRVGRDISVAGDEGPELVLARIEFLGTRGEIDSARILVDALDRPGREALAAKGRYALGNALLRRAFELIERAELDGAGPFVNLSKREYRRAMQLAPYYWDAKFNFDVATRLIRDYPGFEQKHGDELEVEPKKLWTDVPGVPKGLP
ncbi:MxaK protein [Methylocystis heyeri]|uniref:MxaK protein n=1 Tax=Methylocystis heyeri TaxID=391905 RepID=A0A6B8KLS1_9HYPH|nr:MxaK protein [Methylocystis heyeri]